MHIKKKTNKNAKTQNRIIKMLNKIKMKTENTQRYSSKVSSAHQGCILI